uniref:type II toxin-antitoxin system RelE/ParE family toxin n=1 Tax=Pseudanabaena sp. UWO311 TaxID=2487337 RepID=UPI001CC1E858|nr:type II toxin-antitoxin system RelE/ParE family toxin [Pseudanabaena sp. UWO311]
MGTFPNSGRMLPEINLEQIREVIEANYRIIYYVGSDRIDILAVVHGAKNLASN